MAGNDLYIILFGIVDVWIMSWSAGKRAAACTYAGNIARESDDLIKNR